MTCKKYVITFLIITTAMFTINCTSTNQPDNFTATFVAGGIEMPMARLQNRTRVENPILKGVITISLGDEKKTITMNTKKKMYFEEPMKDQPPSIYDSNVVIKKKHVGTEEINGYSCTVFDVVFYRKDNPEEKFEAKTWEAYDLKSLAIKTEMASPNGDGTTFTSEFKNVELGAAKVSMFEVPADYTLAEDLNDVMGFKAVQDVKKGFKSLMDKLKKD